MFLGLKEIFINLTGLEKVIFCQDIFSSMDISDLYFIIHGFISGFIYILFQHFKYLVIFKKVEFLKDLVSVNLG